VVEPLDIASRNLQTFSNGVIDGTISDDDITSLTKRGDDTRNGGESLGIHDTALGTQVCSDICLRFDMDILRSVELWRPAWSDAIGTKRLNSFLLDLFVGVEIVKVVRGEVRDSATIGQL
jgi:hypothetical protein